MIELGQNLQKSTKIVRKMKNKLIIEGTSSPGNVIIDHYSQMVSQKPYR